MYPTFKYSSRYLPGMTPAQIAALPDKARTPVLIATGAIEQHGPQLPVAVDAFLGQVWLTKLFELFPADVPALVGPAITVGKSNEHVGFPGTLIHRKEVLAGHLWAIARQLHHWGFRSILLLNTHGGNTAVLVYTLREIRHQLGLRIEFLYSGAKIDVSAQESTYGFHANEFETSALYAVAPSLCHPEAAPCHYPARIEDPGMLRPECAPATYAWASQDISPHGVMGDATRATRENGERWVKAMAQGYADRLLAHCRELRSSS